MSHRKLTPRGVIETSLKSQDWQSCRTLSSTTPKLAILLASRRRQWNLVGEKKCVTRLILFVDWRVTHLTQKLEISRFLSKLFWKKSTITHQPPKLAPHTTLKELRLETTTRGEFMRLPRQYWACKWSNQNEDTFPNPSFSATERRGPLQSLTETFRWK